MCEILKLLAIQRPTNQKKTYRGKQKLFILSENHNALRKYICVLVRLYGKARAYMTNWIVHFSFDNLLVF